MFYDFWVCVSKLVCVCMLHACMFILVGCIRTPYVYARTPYVCASVSVPKKPDIGFFMYLFVFFYMLASL